MWACVHRYLLVSGVATHEPSNRAITGSIPGDDRFCASMKFSARETATGNRTRALAPVSQKRCHQTTIGIYLFFSQNPHQDLLIGKVTYDRANTVLKTYLLGLFVLFLDLRLGPRLSTVMALR